VLFRSALSACEHPNAMPSGYTYLNDYYKSPLPPPSPKVTSLQRKYMGPQQAERVRHIVYGLVTSLTDRAGLPPKPVYVMRPEPLTPFYGNMDNDLRESLRHTGYILAESPEDAYIFTYTATLISDYETIHDRPPGDTSHNIRIALQVHDGMGENGRLLTKESGEYYIEGAEALHVPVATYKNMSPDIPVNE